MTKKTFGNAVVEYEENTFGYCIPAFYINGKQGDTGFFGDMDHSTRMDRYDGVICTARFEPDSRIFKEAAAEYGIDMEAFDGICRLLEEICGDSNCSMCY